MFTTAAAIVGILFLLLVARTVYLYVTDNNRTHIHYRTIVVDGQPLVVTWIDPEYRQ